MISLKKITCIILYIILIIIAFYLGGILNSFNLNLCYSDSISSLSEESKSVINSNDQKKRTEFEAMLNSLPLNGYESDCEEIKKIIINTN